MITLTDPIVHRITRLRVTGASGLGETEDDEVAVVNVEAGTQAGVMETGRVIVTDVTSTGLRESSVPVAPGVARGGLLSGVTVPSPGGLIALRALVAAASGRPAKLAAIEAWLLSVPGLVPPGSAS